MSTVYCLLNTVHCIGEYSGDNLCTLAVEVRAVQGVVNATSRRPHGQLESWWETTAVLIEGWGDNIGIEPLGAETFENLLGPVTEKLHQNIVFIFEIKIDRPVSHPGFFGDLGHGGLVKTLARKYLYSRFQYQVIFIIFIIPIDFAPSVIYDKSGL